MNNGKSGENEFVSVDVFLDRCHIQHASMYCALCVRVYLVISIQTRCANTLYIHPIARTVIS